MNLAIIDATAAGAERGPACIVGSRYATPIANVPLIAHVFDELARSGIQRAHIIAGQEVRKDLGRLLGGGHPRGVAVSYADAPDIGARAAVLAELEDALSAEPVLLHPGDCLFRSQLTEMRERFCAGDVDSVLPEQASVRPPRLPPAPRVADTVVALGPATRPLVSDLRSTAGEGDDLIASLLTSDCRLAVCGRTENWCWSDSTDSLLAANRMLLDSLVTCAAPDHFGDGNQLHGRVAISPTAYLSNCIVHGPVAIDDHTVLEDAFIGPYSAIGAGAVINGAEIDNSMLLAGSEVHHPGVRIEGSIIGERCRVTRSFQLPKGMHLRLNADSDVTLS